MALVLNSNWVFLWFQGEVGEHGQKGAKGGKGEHVSHVLFVVFQECYRYVLKDNWFSLCNVFMFFIVYMFVVLIIRVLLVHLVQWGLLVNLVLL